MHSYSSLFLLLTVFSLTCNAQVRLTHKSANEVEVKIKDKLFARFIYDTAYKKPFLYDIHDPHGHRVTRVYPLKFVKGERSDHPHHTGFWMSYGALNGNDFWTASHLGNPNNQCQIKIKELNVDKTGLSYHAEWVGEDDKVVLSEHSKYTFSCKRDLFWIDFETHLSTNLDSVVFNDSKEGMTGIRVRAELELHSRRKDKMVLNEKGDLSKTMGMDSSVTTGSYFNSNGISGHKVWGQPAEWVLLKGLLDSDSSSILFCDHPSNYGFPSNWMARDYGLFAVNPFGSTAFGHERSKQYCLKKSETINLKYRLYFFNGSMKVKEIEQMYGTFSKPKTLK